MERAIELIRVAMQQAATDPSTGLIDLDAILIGKTAKSRERVNRLKGIIESILKANANTYKKTSSAEALMTEIERNWDRNDEVVTDKELQEALKMLESDGVLSLFGQYQSRPNFKLIAMD